MKKLLSKYFVGTILLFSVISLVSCGSDDDNDLGGGGNNGGDDIHKSIEVVVGKYKGTMGLYQSQVFDVTLTVEKVDNTHVKVSVDKPLKDGKMPTVKTLEIDEYFQYTRLQTSSYEGFFDYQTDLNIITVSTEKTKETDITFYFVGQKIEE